MSQISMFQNCQDQTNGSSLVDGLAKITLLLENARDKKEIHEAAYLAKSLGRSENSLTWGPKLFLLEKMSKGSTQLMEVWTSSTQLEGLPTLTKIVHNLHLKCSFSILAGFSPNIESESTLSDILETGPIPGRYYLSPKACLGILNRSLRREKELPPQLREALLSVAQETKDRSVKP